MVPAWNGGLAVMKRRRCQCMGCYMLQKKLIHPLGKVTYMLSLLDSRKVITFVVEGGKDVVVWKPVQSGRRTVVSTNTVTIVVGPWSITYVAIAHVVVDVYQVGSMDFGSWQ